jgi:hypothetical protein
MRRRDADKIAQSAPRPTGEPKQPDPIRADGADNRARPAHIVGRSIARPRAISALYEKCGLTLTTAERSQCLLPLPARGMMDMSAVRARQR